MSLLKTPVCPCCKTKMQLRPEKNNYFNFVLFCPGCEYSIDKDNNHPQPRIADLRYGQGLIQCNV